MHIVCIACHHVPRLRHRNQSVQGIVVIRGGISVGVGYGINIPFTVVIVLRKGVIRVNDLVKLARHTVGRVLIDQSLPVGTIVCWIIIALFNHVALGVIVIGDIVAFMIHAPCQSPVDRIILESADHPVFIGPGIGKTGSIITHAGGTCVSLMGDHRDPCPAVISKAVGLTVDIRCLPHLPGSIII